MQILFGAFARPADQLFRIAGHKTNRQMRPWTVQNGSRVFLVRNNDACAVFLIANAIAPFATATLVAISERIPEGMGRRVVRAA